MIFFVFSDTLITTNYCIIKAKTVALPNLDGLEQSFIFELKLIDSESKSNIGH